MTTHPADSSKAPFEPNFLAGRPDSRGQRYDLTHPFDGAVVARAVAASAEVVEEAVAAALGAQPEMARLPRHERAAILERAAELVAEPARAAELARLIVEDSGKPIAYARVEVARASDTLRASADAARALAGEEVPIDAAKPGAGRLAFTRRFPVGAIASISPFNFPLNLVAHKMGPAIAAGCANVLKPASSTPRAALALARILDEAGLPKGGLSVLACARKVGQRLVEHDGPKLLTFTGSAEVGWRLKAEAGKKRVVLELGGNAAAVVLADADVAHAAKRCATGGYYQAGQSCISVQRVIAHAAVYDQLRDALAEETKQVPSGDPWFPKTVCGPLVDRGNADRVEAWVGEALAGGGKALVKGKRKGAFVEPTLLEDVPPGAKVVAEEVFGPVIVLVRATDTKDALAKAAASRFGLQCGIFTNDLSAVLSAWELLEVGGIVHDDAPAFRVDLMPYGGVRDSGLGREGPRFAVQELTEPRLLVLGQRGA